VSAPSHYPTPDPAFPGLTAENHRIVGPASDQYNCIAWACRDIQRWWQPGRHFYWPINADPDDLSKEGLVKAMEAVGFAFSPDDSLEYGFDIIAILANARGEYTHVARRLPTGKWTSKLGVDPLIEHDSLQVIAGGVYGSVVGYWKRPIPPDR
jgi:hypothetical protein